MFKFIFWVMYIAYIIAALIHAHYGNLPMACYDMLWAILLYFWANEK